MDLEQKRQAEVADMYNIESSETFEFDMGAESFTPSSEEPVIPTQTKDVDAKAVETTSVSSEDINNENSKRSPTESLEMSFEELEGGNPPTEEITNEEESEVGEFKFEDGTETEPETKEEEVGEELSREEALLKRIEELEKKQEQAITDKDFETKYSKEKTVMPNISEYDYATLGKELASNGTLSEETYASLAEKGYSKDVVDNHITQTMAQVNAETATPEPVSQEVVKQNFAKELSVDSQGLDNLISDVQNTLSEQQLKTFNDLDSEKQIIMLQKFQLQKLQHEQKVNSKKLIKGNSTKVAPKNPLDGMSVSDLEAKFSEAINNGNNAAIDYWGRALELKGAQTQF